ncbi:8567_t:CDS:2 [Funneliformis caledonium]|uniref:8567_t:CDS:1 n=1 Tax=Funneliformis caledonium TaxID=1117310 RepID=A0A9N9HBA6_9GLOM|nr:8567_t:CDS:2 [Funneliformis caledonium]
MMQEIGEEFDQQEPYTRRLSSILDKGSQILREIHQNSDDTKSTEQIFMLDQSSEKRDQFNKIGVMVIGFNSIYHITDSPSFFTGDKLVILDPHRWYFNGNFQFNFVQKNLAEKFPDSFAPFRIPPFSIPCDEPFQGTLFRYPLRNDTISDISKKTFKPKDILEIFHALEPELLYSIQLENANSVREQCRLLAENIVPMMDLLKSKNLLVVIVN